MSNTQFPNIDFAFRRGFKDSLNTTPIQDGTFNLAKDTGELFIDKDGSRVRINSVITDAGSEVQIRALTNPEIGKLYLTSDTQKLIYFDINTLTWKSITSGDAINSEFAQKDALGNEISEYYYSKEDADADNQSIIAMIQGLHNVIGDIIGFDTVVIDNMDDLPTLGEPGIIYCVKAESYFAPDEAEELLEQEFNIVNNCVELLWIDDPVFDGYFEIIGSTGVDLNNFYTKEEVDTLINNATIDIDPEKVVYLEDIQNILTSLESIESRLTTLENTVSTNVSSLSTAINQLGLDLAGVNGRLTVAENTILEHTSSINTNRSGITTLNGNYATLSSTVSSLDSNMNTTAERIELAEDKIADLETGLTSLTNYQDYGTEDTTNSHM